MHKKFVSGLSIEIIISGSKAIAFGYTEVGICFSLRQVSTMLLLLLANKIEIFCKYTPWNLFLVFAQFSEFLDIFGNFVVKSLLM